MSQYRPAPAKCGAITHGDCGRQQGCVIWLRPSNTHQSPAVMVNAQADAPNSAPEPVKCKRSGRAGISTGHHQPKQYPPILYRHERNAQTGWLLFSYTGFTLQSPLPLQRSLLLSGCLAPARLSPWSGVFLFSGVAYTQTHWHFSSIKV